MRADTQWVTARSVLIPLTLISLFYFSPEFWGVSVRLCTSSLNFSIHCISLFFMVGSEEDIKHSHKCKNVRLGLSLSSQSSVHLVSEISQGEFLFMCPWYFFFLTYLATGLGHFQSQWLSQIFVLEGFFAIDRRHFLILIHQQRVAGLRGTHHDHKRKYSDNSLFVVMIMFQMQAILQQHTVQRRAFDWQSYKAQRQQHSRL